MARRKNKRNRRRRLRRRLATEQLEPRTMLAADLEFLQNTMEATDVNDDGAVTAVDAMLVVNRRWGRCAPFFRRQWRRPNRSDGRDDGYQSLA